ncbi:MAG: hypothetical protein ACODAF_07720 [Actinomycetota bacterium]
MTTDRGAIARAVAAAALGVPGVTRLTGGGGPVRAATHYPGGTVTGVRLEEAKVWVHIVSGRLPLGPLADEVHRAVRAELQRLGEGRRVELVIEDLDELALRAFLRAPRREPVVHAGQGAA